MMSKEKRRVPKLRFPGFTEDWEQRKLGNIVDFLDGQRKPLKESERTKGKYPYYGASGIIDYINDYLFDENLVLLSEDGANIIDRNYPVCFIATGKYWVNNHAHVLKVKTGVIDKFICESLERLDYTKFNTGTAQPKLNQDICQKIVITIPNEDEQKCISEFLDKINNIITLHQRKLDNLKLKKKALLQKLFPKNGERYPELRFPGFTDAWEQRKLESLFTKYEDKVNTPNSGYWRLGLRSHCKGTFHTYIDAGNELETAEMNRVKSGNFILNITFAWERALAVTNDEDQDKLVSHRFPQFKPNSDLVIDFFKHTLMDKRFKHHLELSSPGGAGRNKVLKVADMLKYELLVPSIKEQNEISSFLNHVDYIITLHQRKLDHLQLQKKALLQQMFV